MSDATATSWKRRVLKVAGAASVTALAVLRARYHLGGTDWKDVISRLPGWLLVLLITCAPLAWILIEFLDALLKELATLARGGGKSAARELCKLPEALKNVLARGWDGAAACLSHRSFDGRYCKRLYEDHGLVNDRGLGLINAARLDLEKVFVELQVGSAQLVPTKMELLRHPVEGRRTVWDFLGAVHPGRGLALIGPPGCGKTTLLQHLLLVFARNRQGQHRLRRLLPILIELRSLKNALGEETPPDLAEAIRACWKMDSRLSDLAEREPPGWLELRLRTRRVLLLFDGLDEVPEAQRKQVSQWVQDQMRREGHRHCIFLLTSRPGGYVEAPLPAATVLEVQPFSPKQTAKFIDSWYLANEIVVSGNKDDEVVRRRAGQEANDLRKRLRENPSLYDLTVNPLLLTMVCMVHRYHGALPGSRSQLYGEICQVLLERWRQHRGIADELNGEQKLAILRPLAAEYMRRETREFSEEEIHPIIAEHLANVGYGGEGTTTAARRFLRYIQSSSGLLLERERGRWSFAHKTFQEYLTAEHWLRTPDPALDWATKVSSVWWRETLLLFAAHADASELVKAALAQGSPASWGLAYQCLGEAQSLRSEVRTRANAILNQALHSTDPAVFSPAAAAFHDLRQHETRPISDKLEQRLTPATKAEYQLFLDGLDPNDRLAMVPPHWTADRFVGPPEAPILGVWPWQAIRFAEWASRGTAAVAWRLPASSEPVELPSSSIAIWRSDNSVSPTPNEVPDMTDAWAEERGIESAQRSTLADAIARARELALARGRDRGHNRTVALASALALALALDRGDALALDRELGRAQDRARGLPRDLDFALGLNRTLDLARARASAVDRDRNLARDHARELTRELARALDRTLAFELARELARELTRALALEVALNQAHIRACELARALDSATDIARIVARDRDLARARDLDHDRELVRKLARALVLAADCAPDLGPLRDVRIIREIAEGLRRQDLKAADDISLRRKQLILYLLDMLAVEADELATRRAWRGCTMYILDIARPHLSRKYLDDFAPLRFTLHLLAARETGEVQPSEGILLVRDRSPS